MAPSFVGTPKAAHPARAMFIVIQVLAALAAATAMPAGIEATEAELHAPRSKQARPLGQIA